MSDPTLCKTCGQEILFRRAGKATYPVDTIARDVLVVVGGVGGKRVFQKSSAYLVHQCLGAVVLEDEPEIETTNPKDTPF